MSSSPHRQERDVAVGVDGGRQGRGRARSCHILVSAGEVSGDRIAAPVIRALAARLPRARFFGAGGEALEAAGVEVRHRVSTLSVTGLTEALGRAPAAIRLLSDLYMQIRRRSPVLGILVDYPGINLRLAGLLRRAGVPVLYYVAPQRWAWLESRTGLISRRVDCLAVTLPFEQEWFHQRGVPAVFVGHPSLELFSPLPRQQARRVLGAGSGPVLALLPGSRRNEVVRHLPLLMETLALLPAPHSSGAVLATMPGEVARLCRRMAPAIPQAAAAVALGAADVALVSSGTATLEAAVAGVPAVVFYRLSAPSFWVARWLVQVPFVSLPNLILDHRLLPELMQDEMTPRRMASELCRLLEPEVAAGVREGLARVVRALGGPGASQRVADLALKLIAR